MKRRDLLGLITASSLAGWSLPAAADSSTHILVGAPPGGGTDLVARTLAIELAPRLQRPCIVDNRPGAAGNIAAAAVAKSEPDLGNLLVCYTSHAINASLFPKLPFDPLKDFTPISLIARSPLLLVARPDFAAADVRGLIALGRQRRLSIGIAGVGSANQLAGEMLRLQSGIDMVSIPYKGAGPALTDAMGGQVDLVFSNVASAQELLKAGRLKLLAVSTAKRVAAYPQAAPVADALAGFDYASWYGLLGPAGMRAADVTRLEGAVKAAMDAEAMRQRLASEGLEPAGSTGKEFATYLQQEIERWRKVVVATGVKPE